MMAMRKRILFLFLLVAAIGGACLGFFLRPVFVPPAIVPLEGASLNQTPVYTFAFEDGMETIRIDPDPAVYAGAKAANRSLHLYTDMPEEEWIPIYYLAFINESHQEPFYADLLGALREIRDRRGLDDDRYLELIAVFVQSIPYETDASVSEPKFPIETFVDAAGDCDDKSLLLAGLLAREGYGVSLLYFGGETHMAVGVKSAGCGYRNTSFAYIETTNVSYVGIPPATLSGGATLSSDPLVIPVGEGERSYTACNQVQTIERSLSALRDRAAVLETELEARGREIEAMRDALDALNARMTPLLRAGDISEYNRLVQDYNRMAGDYNQAVDAYNALLDEAERVVDLHNDLAAGAHDRPASYLVARAYPSG